MAHACDPTVNPDNTELELPAKYSETSVEVLRPSSRAKLSKYLNVPGVLIETHDGEVINDYNGLAELAGLSYPDIRDLGRQRNPTEEFLETWVKKDKVHSTIGNLWRYLSKMQRLDVLTDCRPNVLKDLEALESMKNYQAPGSSRDEEQPIESPDMDTSETPDMDMDVDETRYVAVSDVRNLESEQVIFDAFVCYNQEGEDLKFVRAMISKLEKTNNLKLFIPGRDNLAGEAEHTISAYVIEKRCRRMIIVMSKSFEKCPACDFQVRFAHALAPGAQRKKIVPVVIQKGAKMPNILQFMGTCDFTNKEMVDWTWERLVDCIKAPTNASDDDDEINEEELKGLRFPLPGTDFIPSLLAFFEESTHERESPTPSNGTSGNPVLRKLKSVKNFFSKKGNKV